MADNTSGPKMNKESLSPLGDQSGTILVLVLWVIALLTMVAGYFSVEARLRGNMGHSAWNLLKSRLEVESILNLTAIYLAPLDQEQDEEDTDKFIVADGSSYKVKIGGRELGFSLEDERGKIDLNKVDEELLDKILGTFLEGVVEEPSHIVEAILDWKDNDDDKRPGGAEKDYYESLKPAYKPANSKFLLLEQLLLVKGMDPKIFWGPIEWEKSGEKAESSAWKGGIQDLFTVYNQSGVVIRAAAPEPLLDILDEKDLSDKGGMGTLRLKTCLYQGCYQIFWDVEKQQNSLFKLLHWQQIPRFH